MFKYRTKEQAVGTFKANNPIRQFEYIDKEEFDFVLSDAYAFYRDAVEKNAKRKFSDEAWGAYTELRLRRDVGCLSNFNDDDLQNELSRQWNQFVESETPSGASRFAMAISVQNEVVKYDEWAP